MMKYKILIGVTASVAIYRALDLIRDLQRERFDIDVVMTPDATRFIQPMMFSALTGKETWVDAFSAGMPHIHLSRDKDLILVAPATMDFINKFAVGICDNLLLNLCLASKSPIAIAPAMNPQMYEHCTTQESLKRLRDRGVHVIAPQVGMAVCGEVGPGCLAPNAEILSRVGRFLSPKTPWTDVPVLVTAGPTRNYLDPVRFLSNASSGKMGLALAQALESRGARVTLALSQFASVFLGKDRQTIHAAERVSFDDHQSLENCYRQFLKQNPTGVIFAAAAPSDYEILNAFGEKLPKEQVMTLNLKPLPDILAVICQDRHPQSTVVGFCLESHDLEHKAREKMTQKQCDYMIANGPATPGSDEIECCVLSAASGEMVRLSCASKIEVAEKVCDIIRPRPALHRVTHEPV